MRVTNAFWEKRNLGVETVEITVENTDSVEDFSAVLKDLTAQYAVVRVPVARMDFYHLLQKNGFTFAEAFMKVSYHVKDIHYSSEVMRRVAHSLTFRKTSDYSRIFRNIQNGMFTTDRVYLDPAFLDGLAANRYVCWMQDEQQRGSEFYEFFYRNQAIAFICLRKINEETFYPVLGGLYLQDRPLPFGVALLFRQLDVVASKGGTFLTTNISMNNLPVIRAYSQCGYTFSDASYVFIRHQ